MKYPTDVGGLYACIQYSTPQLITTRPSFRNLARGGGQKLKVGDLGGGGGGKRERHNLHPFYINHISQGGEIEARGGQMPPSPPLNETAVSIVPVSSICIHVPLAL